MSHNQFSNILRTNVKENALRYLVSKQKSKGKEISYSEIQMAEYLMPFSKLSVMQKQNMFAIRNRMLEISENFPLKGIEENCVENCSEKLTIIHLYKCEILSDYKPVTSEYQEIFNGSLKEQISILTRIEENIKKKEYLEQLRVNEKLNPPCDPCDPLFCIVMD